MNQTRIKQLQSHLIKEQIELLIVDNKTDLFYLTGLNLSAGFLLISQTTHSLFVDLRYLELAEAQFFPTKLLSSQNIENFIPTHLKTLSFDPVTTTYASYLSWKKEFPLLHVEALNKSPVKYLRSIKDENEKECLRHSATLCAQGFDHVLTLLKEGITEKQVALELEIFWKRRGGDLLSFDPIIAFGKNSSIPHYRSSHTSLKKGDIVLIDIGVTCHDYASDMTRTVFFGPPDPRLKTIYTLVQETQAEVLQLCRSSAPIASLNDYAIKKIQSNGFKDQIKHGIGHGLGLEVHEMPLLKETNPEPKLEESMCITIEPGIYINEVGGVRIENTILIEKDGFEDLTKRSTEMMIL